MTLAAVTDRLFVFFVYSQKKSSIMRKLLLILASFVTLSVSAQENRQEITKSPYITLLGKEYAIGDRKPFVRKLAKDTTFHLWELSSREITAIYNNKNLRKKAYKLLWNMNLKYIYRNIHKDEALKSWYKLNEENIKIGYEKSPLPGKEKRKCKNLTDAIGWYYRD